MNPEADAIQELLQEAWDLRVRSRYQQAFACLEKARALCQIEDYSFLGRIAHIDRQIAADQDHWDLAAEYGWKTIEYYRKASDILKLAHALRHQADIMRKLDCGIEAQALYQKALVIYRKEKKTQTIDLANALRGYALNMIDMGLKEQSREVWQEVAGLYAKINLSDGVNEARNWLDRLD